MTPGKIPGLLAARIGLDCDTLGPTLVEQAIVRRMRVRGLDQRAQYEQLVATDRVEFQELAEELVVPESWFFRDREPFKMLQTEAARWTAHAGDGEVFRVLSLACASGEEPYSIAISLSEAGLPARRFHVVGADLSDRGLARARVAVFRPASLRGLEPAIRDRYFQSESEGSYRLLPPARDAVQFQRCNLLEADHLARPLPFHAVYCRNVLIYLTVAARRQVIGHLYRLLTSDGLLFLGHSEGFLPDEKRFQRTGQPSRYAFRKQPSAVTLAAPVQPALPAPRVPRAPAGRLPAPATPARSPGPADRATSSTAAPRPPAQPAIAPESKAEDGDLLAEAAQLAGADRLEQAIERCHQAIEREGPSARAYHLLGMTHRALGDLAAAAGYLEKAVYLDDRDEEALLALSLIARQQGDRDRAGLYQRRAARANQRKASP